MGRVVLIKDYLKRNAQWRIGRIEGRVIGKDGVTRGYKVRTPNGNLLERPVKLVADLEVGSERERSTETHQETKLNPMAPEFQPQRLSREAKDCKKPTSMIRTQWQRITGGMILKLHAHFNRGIMSTTGNIAQCLHLLTLIIY